MYENEQVFNRMKGAFFQALKEENIKCLEPNELCKQNLIRSHSVQDSRILEQLSENQHVYILKPDYKHLGSVTMDKYEDPKIDFQRISIHEATTFKGLCNEHDTEIFKPIDLEDIDLSNEEHVFLLTYRAMLKEFATLIGTSKMLQKAFVKKVEIGAVDGNVPSIEGILPVIQMKKAFDFYEYKKVFDEVYLTKNYSKIYSEYLILDTELDFAVSSIFTPMEMSKNKDNVERIGINIFPYKNKAFILFSCTVEDKKYMKAYIQDVVSSSGVYQKYLISKLVLRNCENIVFRQSYIDSWTAAKKEKVLKYFMDTCFSDKQDHEDEAIYLF